MSFLLTDSSCKHIIFKNYLKIFTKCFLGGTRAPTGSDTIFIEFPFKCADVTYFWNKLSTELNVVGHFFLNAQLAAQFF